MLALVKYGNTICELQKLLAFIHGIAWVPIDTISYAIMPLCKGWEVRKVNSKLFPKKIFAAIPHKSLPMDPSFDFSKNSS